jgi:succinyldiaminopimelate transaminase
VLPTIGTKEFVAWLPTLMGLDSGSTVAIPRTAYPTYRVGALLAGAHVVEADTIAEFEAAAPNLIWLNSPSNPTGQILDAEHLAEIVAWARQREIPVVSDECYYELAWTAQPVSLLDQRVSGGSADGLLAVHSLSKRSNLAGYRFGFAAGDPGLVASILQVRKHAGMIVPMPIQRAAIAALNDDSHVDIQREVYRARRDRLGPALEAWGLRIDHSEGGLYLWATAGEPCWITVNRLAELGILVAPGDFYGRSGDEHVRVALTATDERIDAAISRLVGVSR